MTPQQHIKDIYGFAFPNSFFQYYEFAQRLEKHPKLQGRFSKGLATLGMYLAEPFEVFLPHFNPKEKDIIKAARYRLDPPEFFTILTGDTDGLHWGYYVDKPSEEPTKIWLANYYHSDAFELAISGRSIFQETRNKLEGIYQERQREIKEYGADYAQKYQLPQALQQLDLIREILMEYETSNLLETGKAYSQKYTWGNGLSLPTRAIIAETRCGCGIVAPRQLYRPLAEDKFQIWNYEPSSAEVQTLVDEAEKAIAEGFPATALKIGKDLWVYRDYERETEQIMQAAYEALERPILQKILEKYRMPQGLLRDPLFLDALERPEKIDTLRLTDRQIGEIPKEMEQLTQLKILDLSFNKLTTLPDPITQLPRLEELYLTGNPIKSLPSTLGKLNQLKKIDLGSTKLTTLPTAIGQLSNLESLRMGRTPLAAIPAAIGQLKKLKHLAISRGTFSAIPDALNELTSLEELELDSGKPILQFPKTLHQLTRLTSFEYFTFYNRDKYPNAEQVFPKAFCELVNLEQLSFSNFKEIPPEFANLQQLKRLSTRYTQWRHMPPVIYELKALTDLSISGNLTSLSDKMANWVNLEHLTLAGNQLQYLPQAITQLKKLKSLNINGNKFDDQVIERLKQMLPNVYIHHYGQKKK